MPSPALESFSRTTTDIPSSEQDFAIDKPTSPWWSPELETNIALAWVPWEASEVGIKYMVKLPDEYSESPGVAVNAEIVDVPFRESVNPNKREVQAAKGLDFAD